VTRNQRASILGFGLVAALVLPRPDSAVELEDRYQTAFSYAGDGTAAAAIRTTQVAVEAAWQQDGGVRVTQVVVEYPWTQDGTAKVTQLLVEIIRRPVAGTPGVEEPPGPAFTGSSGGVECLHGSSHRSITLTGSSHLTMADLQGDA
jgi:hypothetical protein